MRMKVWKFLTLALFPFLNCIIIAIIFQTEYQDHVITVWLAQSPFKSKPRPESRPTKKNWWITCVPLYSSRIGCLWSVEVSGCTFQQDTNLSLTPPINTVGSSITWEQEVVDCWGWAVARSDVSGFVFITDTLGFPVSVPAWERWRIGLLQTPREWERERVRESTQQEYE